MLAIGDTAPLDVQVIDEDGQLTSLNQYLGSYVVLYFYPKDDTPGCTVEACGFRDENTELKNLGITVIGVSKDSVESHKKFKQSHRLTFPLWSDPEHKLLSAFGAWGEKKMFGKTYMGIMRSTFCIDPTGTIIMKWEKVNPNGHSTEVLDFMKKYIEEHEPSEIL